ncbi:MAG: methyltransferase [Alphaproteobacteria bacterium]|nr:methyltransferase [Alphaproteobacteria bacterium]
MKIEINTLLGGKVKIAQFEKGVKVSSDAVLLASVIDEKLAKKIHNVLDVGVGGGGVSLCLLSRFKNMKSLGIDVQDEMLGLAEKSIIENNFQNRFSVAKDDILKPSKKLKDIEFDLVITNPPYYKGHTSPDKIKAKAHSEQGLDLTEWIKMCIKRLRTGGTFAMVHKAERIDDIMFALKQNGMGRIEVVLLYSKKGETANRVLVRAVKSVKSPAIVYPPVVLHNIDGSYTQKAQTVLLDGKSII